MKGFLKIGKVSAHFKKSAVMMAASAYAVCYSAPSLTR
jgi:hypothetical protein